MNPQPHIGSMSSTAKRLLREAGGPLWTKSRVAFVLLVATFAAVWLYLQSVERSEISGEIRRVTGVSRKDFLASEHSIFHYLVAHHEEQLTGMSLGGQAKYIEGKNVVQDVVSAVVRMDAKELEELVNIFKEALVKWPKVVMSDGAIRVAKLELTKINEFLDMQRTGKHVQYQGGGAERALVAEVRQMMHDLVEQGDVTGDVVDYIDYMPTNSTAARWGSYINMAIAFCDGRKDVDEILSKWVVKDHDPKMTEAERMKISADALMQLLELVKNRPRVDKLLRQFVIDSLNEEDSDDGKNVEEEGAKKEDAKEEGGGGGSAKKSSAKKKRKRKGQGFRTLRR